MDTISKSEAIEAMLEGKKVRHRYFSDDEWMTMIDPATILLEDGVKCHPLDFWADRKGSAWDTDWSIVADRKSEKEQKPMPKLDNVKWSPEEFAAWHSLKENAKPQDYKTSWVVDAIKEYAHQETEALRQENQQLREANDKLLVALRTYRTADNENPSLQTSILTKAQMDVVNSALQNTKGKMI